MSGGKATHFGKKSCNSRKVPESAEGHQPTRENFQSILEKFQPTPENFQTTREKFLSWLETTSRLQETSRTL
jgi:hypothetical protein